MKGCILEANLEKKRVLINTANHFVDSNLRLEKEEQQKKGALK